MSNEVWVKSNLLDNEKHHGSSWPLLSTVVGSTIFQVAATAVAVIVSTYNCTLPASIFLKARILKYSPPKL